MMENVPSQGLRMLALIAFIFVKWIRVNNWINWCYMGTAETLTSFCCHTLPEIHLGGDESGKFSMIIALLVGSKWTSKKSISSGTIDYSFMSSILLITAEVCPQLSKKTMDQVTWEYWIGSIIVFARQRSTLHRKNAGFIFVVLVTIIGATR